MGSRDSSALQFPDQLRGGCHSLPSTLIVPLLANMKFKATPKKPKPRDVIAVGDRNRLQLVRIDCTERDSGLMVA